MDLDEWQGKTHKNRRKNPVQNMSVANCSCVVLATPVNYDGHFTLPATSHARTHARASTYMILEAGVLFLTRKIKARKDEMPVISLPL